MEEIFSNFDQILIHNTWLAIAIALIAGIISSFSPCTLSTIPLIMGYVARDSENKAFKYSLFFCIGLILTFTTLGALSAILGKLMTGVGNWWYLILGTIMLVIGLHLLGFININNNVCKIPSKKFGTFGAFFLGIVGGIVASPCATPVLVAILAFVASQQNIILGIILLAVYSLGHCILIIIAGTSVGIIHTFAVSTKTQKIGNLLNIILGIILILISFYLFYTGF